MKKTYLLTSAGAFGLALATIAGPAQAQDTPQSAPAATAQDDQSDEQGGDIIVTGSIVRNPAAATASPVVSVTDEDLSNLVITTITDALQLLTANGSVT